MVIAEGMFYCRIEYKIQRSWLSAVASSRLKKLGPAQMEALYRTPGKAAVCTEHCHWITE